MRARDGYAEDVPDLFAAAPHVRAEPDPARDVAVDRGDRDVVPTPERFVKRVAARERDERAAAGLSLDADDGVEMRGVRLARRES